jgi:hypothetical protein
VDHRIRVTDGSRNWQVSRVDAQGIGCDGRDGCRLKYDHSNDLATPKLPENLQPKIGSTMNEEINIGSENNGGVSIQPAEAENQGYIRLPFKSDQFKDFISSLLGSPQALNGSISGSYRCTPEAIRDIFSLLDTRVSRQNNGKMIQFTSILYFSDNTSIEINSLAELITYRDPGRNPIIRLDTKSQYLTSFSSNKVPEKQTVEINFFSFWDGRAYLDQISKIDYRIEHTDRTFGYDIRGLIDVFLENLVTKRTGWIEWMYQDVHTKLFFINSSLVFFGTSVFMYSTLSNYSTVKTAEAISRFNEIRSSTTPLHLNEKINLLFDVSSARIKTETPDVFLAIISVGLPLALMFFTSFSRAFNKNKRESFLVPPYLSFILFSSASEKYEVLSNKKYSKSKFYLFWIVFGIIVSAIIGNGAYDIFKNLTGFQK